MNCLLIMHGRDSRLVADGALYYLAAISPQHPRTFDSLRAWWEYKNQCVLPPYFAECWRPSQISLRLKENCDSTYENDLPGAMKVSSLSFTLLNSRAVMLFELSYANALISRCFTYWATSRSILVLRLRILAGGQIIDMKLSKFLPCKHGLP